MRDEMIKNKTWQHEETGRLTTCAIRPGNRWHQVDSAMDCEHEDLTGKTCAQHLRDAAARLAPEGKFVDQVTRHVEHIPACNGDKLASVRLA